MRYLADVQRSDWLNCDKVGKSYFLWFSKREENNFIQHRSTYSWWMHEIMWAWTESSDTSHAQVEDVVRRCRLLTCVIFSHTLPLGWVDGTSWLFHMENFLSNEKRRLPTFFCVLLLYNIVFELIIFLLR